MKRQSKIVIGVILVAILLMAIGYANLEPSTLTITGSAEAKADQSNFKVYFTGANTKKYPNTDDVKVTANAEATTADVKITGLTKKGDTAYAILEIANASNNIDAESVKVTTYGTDTSIIDIEVEMCDVNGTVIEEDGDFSVKSGEKTYVKVTATVLQTPTTTTSATITATITATPAEVVAANN